MVLCGAYNFHFEIGDFHYKILMFIIFNINQWTWYCKNPIDWVWQNTSPVFIEKPLQNTTIYCQDEINLTFLKNSGKEFHFWFTTKKLHFFFLKCNSFKCYSVAEVMSALVWKLFPIVWFHLMRMWLSIRNMIIFINAWILFYSHGIKSSWADDSLGKL